MLLNASSWALCTVRPNKQKCRSLEQRKVYCRPSKENRWFVLKRPELPDGFQGEVFIGKIWGAGCRVCDFLPIGWWWGNRAVLQESHAQPEVTILHLSGVLSSCRRTQRYYVYPLRRNQDPAPSLHCCFLSAPPLFLCPLPSLISNCLNLHREGLGGWSLFPANQKNGDTERLLYLGEPHRVLLSFKTAQESKIKMKDCGDHFVMYWNIESLCCAPGTNIVL